ncbi:MAG: ABC transporter substrate-binding protein [Clostridiaceae bacterium]
MKKKIISLSILLALGASILGGCAVNKYINKDAAAAKELKTFNVGYLASTEDVLYFVAQEKGYFKEEGLDVKLFLFANSGEGLNAITAGKVETGPFGTAAPLTFISKGNDLTIYGGEGSEGAAIVAKPEKVDQFKDLTNYKGKTIGTIRLATGDVVLRGALAEAGLDWKKDLTIKEFDTPNAVLEAVKKGSVDAGVVWSPYRTLAEQQGLKIAKQSGELYKNHTCCRTVALTSKIKENPKDYEAFLRALIKAYKFYKANESETIDIIAKYVQIDKSVIKAETYGPYIDSNPNPDKEAVVKFWELMNKAGYISSDIKIQNYINTDIYKNALDDILKNNPDDAVYKKLKDEFNQ